MIFPEQVKSIRPSDRVLEIGPGALPHERADVFLELRYSSEEEHRRQSGDRLPAALEKPVVYYDGEGFPFADAEFDYVICSHVIEHVLDVPLFMAEMFRVAKRGYLEYPTILFDYLYNFSVHVNFIKRQGESLVYMRKDEAEFERFRPVHDFFFAASEKGHTQMVSSLNSYMFEGFEWESPFEVSHTDDIGELMWKDYDIQEVIRERTVSCPVKRLMKRIPGLVRMVRAVRGR